jgi:hypothetical protein
LAAAWDGRACDELLEREIELELELDEEELCISSGRLAADGEMIAPELLALAIGLVGAHATFAGIGLPAVGDPVGWTPSSMALATTQALNLSPTSFVFSLIALIAEVFCCGGSVAISSSRSFRLRARRILCASSERVSGGSTVGGGAAFIIFSTSLASPSLSVTTVDCIHDRKFGSDATSG